MYKIALPAMQQKVPIDVDLTIRIIVGSKPHSQAPITLCNLDIICSIKHETETKILANCEHNDVRTSPRVGESPYLCLAGKLIIGYSPRLYSHVDVMCENPGP